MTSIFRCAYDLLGVALVGGLVGWIIVSASVSGGDPTPQVSLLLATTGAYVLGRLLGSRLPTVVAGAVAAAVLIFVSVTGADAISGRPLAPPLGYGNANAALYVQGVAAAAMVAVSAGRLVIRTVAWLAAIALTGVAVMTGSVAGTALAMGCLVAALLAPRLDRRVATAALVIVMAAIIGTATLGATYGSAAASRAAAVVSERRVVLWHDAVTLAREHPAFGVGSGRFDDTSPTALRDHDARWTHSAYLQTVAETGLPGAALLGTLVVWLYGALRRSARDPRLVVLATASTTALALHAAIDYVAHFAAVPLATAVLVGLGTGRR
jgi:O-antigen ligase